MLYKGSRFKYVCSTYVWSALATEYESTGYSCQSCSRSAEQENRFFPCPRSLLRISSRETGSVVPSRVLPLILHTQAESGTHSCGSSRAFHDGVHIYRQPPSGQSRVNGASQIRTDGVHCRESVGTGPPVVLKVVPVTHAAAFSGFTIGPFFYANV